MGNSNDTMHIGYRILSVDEDGPMAGLSLEPMLDFIVYPDSSSLGYSFEEAISSTKDKPLELTIYNLVSRVSRKVSVTPRSINSKNLLGITARAEDYSTAHFRAIHVLTYLPQSPLEKAGLIPYKDYILGSGNEAFPDLDDFENFIKKRNHQTTELSVYNSDTELERKVRLVPNNKWGGGGYLGGDFGYGKLHAIPKKAVIEHPDKKLDKDLLRSPKIETAVGNNRLAIEGIISKTSPIGSKAEILHSVFKAAIEKAVEIKAGQDDKNIIN